MFFNYIGKKVIQFFVDWGNITSLSMKVGAKLFKGRSHTRATIDQMITLGIDSLGITVVTAVFTGMAFSVQVVREFIKFGAADMVGGVVGLAIWRELGPLLTGVVVCGRVGAAISAELGTMKVKEQIEALESMAQDSVDFLVVPRVLACAFMMPLLVGLADIVGFLSGLLVAVLSGNINPYSYFGSAESMLRAVDIWGGLVKGVVFGIVIALLSSYMGLKATGGAKGVGEMTTKGVVVSLFAVFIINYLLSIMLFQI
ncbi:ABC transporter permease [bacterium]|jgi:phospholipid/cholesterol/gamma-HCH transport system permease protein|nr:ABC transporter permease [bacterium]